MSDCVLAAGWVSHEGYVKIRAERHMWLAHRWAWTQAFGSIPEGMVVHHDCGTRACINVTHLSLMSRYAHTRLHNLQHSRLEHAARTGHEFEPAPGGFRANGEPMWRCRVCRNEADRRRRS